MKFGLYSSASWQEPTAGFHEYGDEPPYYIMFLSCSLFSFLFYGCCGFVAYFTTLSASTHDRMTDQLKNDLEGSGHDLMKVLSQHFPRNRKTIKKPQLGYLVTQPRFKLTTFPT
jgi:hypothetical protein